MKYLFLAPVLWSASCAQDPGGLWKTPAGDGPLVEVDWDAEPLPELPFPNDLSTTPDASSPTGLRLNIPTEADTVFESEIRTRINQLTGFGLYMPISVSFEQPLDLQNIVDRHPNDLHLPTTFDDDAILVIDVDPDSPHWGEPVALDVGHGRFPADVFQTDRYFPNDSRASSPSLLFDTVNEDLDGDGKLDPGEDSDNDGVLDRPNVFPADGDPADDLLSFYDMQSDTLIVRPVVPLREHTTYAVVLTDRLVGRDGAPVRSPWEWVHHTRQTTALEPLVDILPDLGLAGEDVAFAWTFTTTSPTRDLRDLRRGLFDAQGPYAQLATDFPPGVTVAHHVDGPEEAPAYTLQLDRILSLFSLLDLSSADVDISVFIPWIETYSGRLVGGDFTSPNLLADRDDGGVWDADESWQLDPYTGHIEVESASVPFTCVLPKEELGFEQPYPVLMYGHGYGSTRLEIILFAALVNRFGIATCAFDSPGHGTGLSGTELDLALAVLEGAGLVPALNHTVFGRFRDLDNDGAADSGGDAWGSEPFHTRDVARQTVLDWMQLHRTLRACGTGEMAESLWEDGALAETNGSRMACDWDDDGVPDIGGPEVPIYLTGLSLGGVYASIAAGILPDVDAFIAIVPGGGLVDIGVRTLIGGGVEAFVGRLLSPMFLGIPDGDGLRIVQYVNSVKSMHELPVGRLDSVPTGGQVVVTNLTSGLERTGTIPDDGRFRVAIAADAMEAGVKAREAGIPPTGPEPGVVYDVVDNHRFGDELLVEIRDATGALVATFDTWPEDVLHEGVTFGAGTPLVAGNRGHGRIRGSSDARRLAQISAMIVEPGDPIVYARAYHQQPFEEFEDGPRNVFLMPTPGDDQVPINAGIALARAAGMYDWRAVDDRYGMTIDQWLIDREVIRGIEQYGPWTDATGAPALFDPDDLDDGTDDYGAPSDAPLRATVETSAGTSGMRLPYIVPNGIHGFRSPNPELAFDINTYVFMQVGDYLLNGGKTLRDRRCYEDASCPEFPTDHLDP